MTLTSFIRELDELNGFTAADKFEAIRRAIDATEDALTDSINDGNVKLSKAIEQGFEVVLDSIQEEA